MGYRGMTGSRSIPIARRHRWRKTSAGGDDETS
jgi:hypothetical protein